MQKKIGSFFCLTVYMQIKLWVKIRDKWGDVQQAKRHDSLRILVFWCQTSLRNSADISVGWNRSFNSFVTVSSVWEVKLKVSSKKYYLRNNWLLIDNFTTLQLYSGWKSISCNYAGFVVVTLSRRVTHILLRDRQTDRQTDTGPWLVPALA